MKGKRTLKRFLAVVMAVVFTVTGITFTPKDAQAYVWNNAEGEQILNGYYWYSRWGGDYVQYDNTTNGMSFKFRSGGSAWEAQCGIEAGKDTQGNDLVSGSNYTYSIKFTPSTSGTITYQALTGSNKTFTMTAGKENEIEGSGTYSGITKLTSHKLTVLFQMQSFPAGTIMENLRIELTPAAAPTTTSDGYTEVTGDGGTEWTRVGAFQMFKSWGSRTLWYKGTGTIGNPADMSVKIKGSSPGSWGTQIAIYGDSLTNNTVYDYSITFNSNNSGTVYTQKPDPSGVIQSSNITVSTGSNTISGSFTYSSSHCPGHGTVLINGDGLSNGTILDFTSVTITEHTTPTETETETETETTTSDGWIDIDSDATFNDDTANNGGYQVGYASGKNLQYKKIDGYTHIRNHGNTAVGDVYILGFATQLANVQTTYDVSFTYNLNQSFNNQTNNIRGGQYYVIYNGWESEVTSIGDNTFSYQITVPGTSQNRMTMHITGSEIPAGTEITLKGFTCTAQAATAVDVTAVTASSSSANSISASWTPGSNVPAGQVYEVYLDNEQSPRYTTADETETSKTLTGVAAGSHTVTVKSKYNDSYASAAGVTSNSATVYDPNPVAPSNVAAVDSATQGEALDVTITASASAVAGQTYNVYLDDDTTPIATGVAAGTYTYDVGDLSSHTIKVAGYLATAATTESSKTSSNSAASTWKKATGTWSSAIDNWQFLLYGTYGNDTAMDYKGTTGSDNLQVRVDHSSGDATGGHYALQMKQAYSALYSGLTAGVTYTMTISADSSQNSGGVYAQGDINQTFNINNSKLTITKQFVCPASPSGDLIILLDGLTAGTVLSNFDVSFTADTVPCPNPASVTGAPVANTNDAITVTWNPGSGALADTVYDIYLDDDSTPTLTGQAASASPVTINNLPASKRGTGHTVKVVPKVTVGGTTYTNTGTTSSAFEIYGPIDISTIHDVVTASTISVHWDNPANANSSQRYNVYYKESSAGSYTTAATGITAPTSASPLTIENLTAGTEYTVLVKAVVNSEESTGVTKNITPQSVDPSWIATPASGYTWPEEASGVGFVNSPNLYYKVGSAPGSQAVSIMSFLNANSEAIPLRILSPSYMSRTDVATTYTISLTFTSDTASAGGTWEHGLKNSAVTATGTSSKTISSGSNTYTESISYTSTSRSNQAVNGYYYIEVPAGATIEIKSFTVTSNDSLNPYLNTIQDNTWRQMAGSASGTTGKWWYKMTQNGWDHGGVGYYNAENYGETSTGAGNGLHIHNSVHRPWSSTYKTFLNTAAITTDTNGDTLETGRQYDVEMKVTLTDYLSSGTQYIRLSKMSSSTSDDVSGTIDSDSVAGGGTPTEVTLSGTIRGDSSGIYLGLYFGSMEMLDLSVDSLTITPTHSGKTAVGDGGWHQSKDNSGNNGLWYYKLPASTAQQTYSAVYSGSGTDSSGSYTGLSVTNESTTSTTLRWATQDLKTKYSLTEGKAYTATVTLNLNNRSNSTGTVGLYKKTGATVESQTMFATGQSYAASTNNQTITLTGPVTVDSGDFCLEVVVNNAYDLDFTVSNITFTALDGKAMDIPSLSWERTELNSSSSPGKWYYYNADFGNDEKVVTYKNADNYGASSNGFTYKSYSRFDHPLRVATQDLVSDYSLSAGKRYTVTMVVDATSTDENDKTLILRKKASPTADASTNIDSATIEADTASQELTLTSTVDLASAALSLELYSADITNLEITVKSLTITEETGNVADTDGSWHQSALNDGTVSGLWWYKYDETSADASGFYKDASSSTYDGFTFSNEEAIVSTDGKGLLLSTGNLVNKYGLVNGATYKAVVHTTIDNYDNSTAAIGLNSKTAGPNADTGRAMISDHFTYVPADSTNQTVDLSGAFTVENNAAYLEVEMGGVEHAGTDPQTVNRMKVTVDSIEFYPGAHSDNQWHTCTEVDGTTTNSKWHYKVFHEDSWNIADSYNNADQYEGFVWDNSVYSNGHAYFATTNLAAASAYNLADGTYNCTVVLEATGSHLTTHQANTPVTINVKDSTRSDTHTNHLAPTQNLTYTMNKTEMTFRGNVTVTNGELYLEVQMGEPKEVSSLMVKDISFDDWIPVIYGAEPVTVGNSKLWVGNDESGNHYNFSYHNSTTGYSNLRAKITENDASDLSTAADGYGMQVKVPNNIVYTAANNSGEALVEGAVYTMTMSYTTTAAGYMRINTEGYTPYPAKQQATAAGEHTITYEFTYAPAHTIDSEYVVIMLQGFPEDTIISGIDFAITGGVKPGVGITGKRISRSQGQVTWSDPVGMSQFYNVYIGNSASPVLSNVRAGTHTLNNIPDTAASDYTVVVKAVRGGEESTPISTTITDWIEGKADGSWHDVDGYGYKFDRAECTGEYSFTYNGNAFAINDTYGSYPEWGCYEIGSDAKTVEAGQQYAYSITVEREKTDEIAVRLDGGTFDGGTPANQTPSEAGEDITFTGTFTATSNTVRLYTNYSWPGNGEKIAIKSCNIAIPNQVELTNTGNANHPVQINMSSITGLDSNYTLTYQSGYEAVTNEAIGTLSDPSLTVHYLSSMPDNQTKVYVKDGSGNVKGVALAQADLTITDVKVNYYKYGEQRPIHTNTNNTVEIVVKNVGTAKANIVRGPGAYQDLGVKASEGTWYNTDWAFDEVPGSDYPAPTILDPEGTRVMSVNGWRPIDIREYTLTCEVNHENWIPESDYSNNVVNPPFTTTAQLEDSTAVLGFQLNTDTETEKGPSYFNPSFRTVCRALKQVEVNNQMKNVTGYGFVFAKTDAANMGNQKNEMTVENAKTFTKKDGTVVTHENGNEYIKALEAKENVDYNEYTTHGSTYTKENSYFFALTFQDLYYTTASLEQQYTFRSYLTYTDNNGETQYVYPNDIYTTSLYEIAEDLYKYRKMKTEEAHDFLYDYILNIISMKYNYSDIMKATLKTLGVTSSNRNTSPYKEYYQMANMNYKDMYYYAMCTNGYGYKSGNKIYDGTQIYTDEHLIDGAPAPYTHDYVYRSKQLDESTYSNAQFLGLLNTATDTSYENFPDWARGCVGKTVNGINLTQFKGMYKKVSYDWDSNLDKDYGKSQ